MEKETLKILLIEDNPGDARLFELFLSEAGTSAFEVIHAERLADGLAYLEEVAFDAVLLDLGLPDCQGIATFEQVYARVPQMPIIVLSGLDDSDVAVKAVQAGAQDYLVKGHIDEYLLPRAIHYAIERVRAQRLQATLYRISQAANRATTPEELYPAIHEIIREIMPADNFYIALYNPSTDRLHMVYIDDEIDPTPVATTKNGSTEYVYHTGKTLLGTAAQFEALQQSGEIVLCGAPSAVWLGVPLIVEGKIIGVMTAQHYRDAEAYGEDEQHILEMISASVANTITRQLAQAETRRKATQQAALFQLTSTLAVATGEDALLQSAMNDLHAALGYDHVGVFLVDEGTGERVLRASVGWEHAPAGHRIPPGQGLSERPLLDGQLHYTPDVQKAPRYVESLSEGSELDIPLFAGDEIIGMLFVESKKIDDFDEDDFAVLSTAANQIGVALENIRLLQQIRDHAAELEERIAERTADLKQRVEMVQGLNLGMSNLLSDLNAANAIAEENARRLEQINAELESFSYSVSHDLRAPLRHIDSFGRLLLERAEGKLDKRSAHYLDNILNSTDKMGVLIDDLLTFSRTGRAELRFKVLVFNKMIAEIRAEMRDATEGRELVWKVDSLPPVKADPGLMRVVWTNLLSNAVKYTRPRGQALIEVGVLPPAEDTSGEAVTFFVRDNGVGFDPEYIDKLFGVFQRLHQDEEFEGTGIGLATVRRIIHRHTVMAAKSGRKAKWTRARRFILQCQ